jgi:chaperonin GroES
MINPIYDNVLIELPVTAGEEKTSSGIFIPSTSPKERPQTGVVVATGQGRLTESGETVPLFITKGQKVLYQKYAGTEIKEGSKEYLLLKERDILAIITD